jgi:putative SOS response-associated peptidase YedK
MCTNYRIHHGQAELASLFKAVPALASNQTPSNIFPDRLAPIVRMQDGERQLIDMRWGFPPPPKGDGPVVNVRNVSSPYWRAWLKPAQRCLVPFSAFSEWTFTAPTVQRWFTLGEDQPIGAFAGIWRPWEGVRGPKSDPVTGDHLLFAFLTTGPNEVVREVHTKAMPVILATKGEQEAWLHAPTEIALELQRPLADGVMLLDD